METSLSDPARIAFEREGSGKDLLLIHGLGGNRDSFRPISEMLSAQRTLIKIDLPGHGESFPQEGSGTFAGLADQIEQFLGENGLERIDMVGSSLGARLVLAMARRGKSGNVVALDPGGFWEGWERKFFATTIGASIGLLRMLGPGLGRLARNPLSRSVLLAQLSARPWALDGNTVAAELKSYVGTSTFDALVTDLASGPTQHGPAAAGSGRIVIGWGRHDRLCLARQAKRAVAQFPSARLHWFEQSGHFPMWDEPEATAKLILASTG